MKSPAAVCPRGRPTLVCGGAGCGKTLLAMQFLVHGATECGEPGVFMAFEEMPEELTENVASLGFDLKALVAGNFCSSIMSKSSATSSRKPANTILMGSSSGLAMRLTPSKPSAWCSTRSKHCSDESQTRRSVRESLHGSFAGSRKRASPSS